MAGVINLDYLRSGRAMTEGVPLSTSPAQQIHAASAAGALGSSPTAQAPAAHTPNEKLQKFHDETLSAVECAIQDERVTRDFKIAKNEAKTIVNLDFLRSGGEFTGSKHEEEEGRKRSQSMNEKLQKYHDETLTAVECAIQDERVTRDFKIAKTEAKSLVNVDYLRSGAEFTDVPCEKASPEERRRRTRSENERLNQFHERTLLATTAAPPTAPKPSVVNVSFLTSGQQFAPPSPSTSPQGGRSGAVGALASSPATATMPGSPRSTRLEEFHARTAAAAAGAAKAGLTASLKNTAAQ